MRHTVCAQNQNNKQTYKSQISQQERVFLYVCSGYYCVIGKMVNPAQPVPSLLILASIFHLISKSNNNETTCEQQKLVFLAAKQQSYPR